MRSTKHAADWINSLERHVPAALWHAPIAEIKAPDFLDFFVLIRRSHRETGRRVVQRLRKVYSDAVFRDLATANVAAAATERLRELGIRREAVSYAALPFGEVIGAQWDEFNLDAGVWIVPKDRMKGGEVHTVYLSPRAVEIVKAAQRSTAASRTASPARPMLPGRCRTWRC